MTGQPCNIGDGDPRELDSPDDWGPERTIRGHVLAELLIRAGAIGQPAIREVAIHGARVTGVVDLSHAKITAAVHFERCQFQNDAILEFVQTRTLQLQTCVLAHVNAMGASIEGLLRITQSAVLGGINLMDAEVSRSLVFIGSTIVSKAGLAVVADRLKVDGSVILGHGFHAIGAVRLSGTEIAGQLDCSGGQFNNPRGDALLIEGANVRGGVGLHCGFHATGAVRLSSARIGNDLNCSGGRFENQDGSALAATHAQIENNVFLNRVFNNKGFHSTGQVQLTGARIGGNLDCTGGLFENSEGDALSADRINVGDSVLLRSGFHAMGEVRFLSARIGGNLDCTGGLFKNSEGDALSADGTDVRGSVFLQNGFHATGEVRLLGARIGGNLECTGGRFENFEGDALSADGADVRGSAFLRDGFKAMGTVRLTHAQIGSQLAVIDATLCKTNGNALNLQYTRAAWLSLRGSCLNISGTLDFRSAQIGMLGDAPQLLSDPVLLYLDGFVYERIAPDSPRDVATRVQWLQRQPEGYHPQPFDQLAEVFRRNGQDYEAQQVLIAKRRKRRRTVLHGWPFGWPRRFWDWILDWSVGYGWQPWRPLIFGIVFFLLVLGLVFTAQAKGLVAGPSDAASSFHLFTFAADLFLSTGDLSIDSGWTVDTAKGGAFAWLVIVSLWGLKVVGLGTVALVTAAQAGIVKRR